MQACWLNETGPLYDLPDESKQLNFQVWHRLEVLAVHFYTINIYLRNGRWNAIDLINILLFLLSFSIRFFLPPETFQLVRISFAVTIIFCYFRLLRFWFVLSSVGPSIIAIQMMVSRLLSYLFSYCFL
jgi:hypothetical protein